MARSTRQYVFEGMELLPEALIPFVEKRLESSLTGHWQVQVVEKLPGLKPNGKGGISWDQATLLNAMDRFWLGAFKAVLAGVRQNSVSCCSIIFLTFNGCRGIDRRCRSGPRKQGDPSEIR